jgi:hypothetical protein
MLTELWIEEYGRAKSTASLTGGGARAAFAEGGSVVVLRRLDTVVRLGVLLRRFHVVREVREWPAVRNRGGAESSPA